MLLDFDLTSSIKLDHLGKQSEKTKMFQIYFSFRETSTVNTVLAFPDHQKVFFKTVSSLESIKKLSEIINEDGD